MTRFCTEFVRRPLLPLIALLACTDPGSAPSSEATVRVEDGVTIVENPGLYMADTLAWTIDTANAVRIGMIDGPDEYVIGRLAGTLRLRDGNILMADAIAHELRVFDERGQFVRKVGRVGGGPGEYANLSKIFHYTGDSIVVIDREGGRATVLDPELGYVRRYRPRLEVGGADVTSRTLVGFFADGQALVRHGLHACGRVYSEGFCEDSAAFFRTDEAGRADAAFGRFVYNRGEFYPVRPGSFIGWSEPHPQAAWAVRGDRFYYADAMRFEIKVFTQDGTLERIVRVNTDARTYEKGDVWPSTNEARAGDAEQEARSRVLRDAQASASMPHTFPAFSDMLIDPSGNIWLREYLPTAYISEPPPRWFIFDEDGRLRWALRAPEGMLHPFRPTSRTRPQIGEDYVLTSAYDLDGVESVLLYPLLKRQR